MHQNIGAFLRSLRCRRGMSQTELARRAHVAERTLRYWEAGRWEPGNYELESVLSMLQATPQERALALSLLKTPRGVQLARQEATAPTDFAPELGPLPGTGDLLQAMRARRGLTQVQMAKALGISRSTILRWEVTETFPSEENLGRACALLEASPQEQDALTARRLTPWEQQTPMTIEECAAQADVLDKCGLGLLTPLIDLFALALKRRLWLMAGQTVEAVRLLARVQVVHASWLLLQDRMPDASACTQRSLMLLRPPLQPELFWQAALNLAIVTASREADGTNAAMQLLRHWIPAFPVKMQATLWCDLAVCAGRAREEELAAAYLDRAREVIPLSSEAQGLTEHYFPLTNARVLLHSERPAEALDWLPPVPDVTAAASARAAYQMLWAEAFLKAGEKDAAQRLMDQLDTLFAAYPQPRLERKFHALSACI